jgi:hypothetical protein
MADLATKDVGVDAAHLEDDVPTKSLVQSAAVGSNLEHELSALEAIKWVPFYALS